MSSTRTITDVTDITKLEKEADGTFKRPASSFRNQVVKGGKFEPERDRYHLYVSYACPWAHRTLIVRKLKGLENIIPYTSVSPRMNAQGWPFADVEAFPDAGVDDVNNAKYVKDLYFKADPNYTGRFTVPVLWDKHLNTIVNNESSEIIRIFNTAFNDFVEPEKAVLDLYPLAFRGEIDGLNAWIYDGINNGVYKSGLADTQTIYENAVKLVFSSLDRVESILSKSNSGFLIGDALTEADVRLFPTIIRFDTVYYGHFKCNFRTIRDGYPAIHIWLRRLYWTDPAFRSTTKFDHIKTHYYWSHTFTNPRRIVPLGPVPNIKPLDDQ